MCNQLYQCLSPGYHRRTDFCIRRRAPKIDETLRHTPFELIQLAVLSFATIVAIDAKANVGVCFFVFLFGTLAFIRARGAFPAGGRFVRMMETREQYCRSEAARLSDRAHVTAGKVERTKRSPE